MIGQVISHYKILEKLGEGGMGIVYKAHDTKLDRTVALKFLPPQISATDQDKSRFTQEARAAAALNHPNVCHIYRIDEVDAPPASGRSGEKLMFIEMEYVEGVTVRKKVAGGPLPVGEALAYATQIGEALEEAHGKGIVHRDIKSDNIMVNARAQAKVMDFGLAKLKGALKLTRSSSTVGTLAYMAPEQIRGAEADARSDIFSFGAVLFEMLTGRVPFEGAHEAAMMYSIVNEPPMPLTKFVPDAAPELVHIINRSLEKDPEDRYQNVHDMVIDIRRARKDSTTVSRSAIPAMPPAAAEPASTNTVPDAPVTPKPTHRTTTVTIQVPTGKKTWMIAAAVVVLAALGIFAFLKFGGADEGTARLSIAVADFQNRTNEPELDGLSGMLTTAMEQSKRLSVVTRTHMFDILKQMGKANVEKIDEAVGKEICAKAGIGALVTASIQKFGKLYTIDLKVLDPTGNEYVFTAKEEGEGQESIPGMLDKLSERTRASLKDKAGEIAPASSGLAVVTTTNMEAYGHYFKGEEFLNKLDMPRAEAELRKAVTLDSSFALAWYRLAYVVDWRLARGSGPDNHEMAKALALIDRLPDKEKYLLRAISVRAGATSARAIAILKEMEARYPDDKEMIYNIGDWSFHDGDFQTATAYLTKTLELDPLHDRALEHLTWTYRELGQYSKMIETAKRFAEVAKSAESYNLLATAYANNGRQSEGVAEFEKLRKANPTSIGLHIAMGHLLSDAGEYEKAEAVLNAAPDSAGGSTEPEVSSLVNLYGLTGRYRDLDRLLDKEIARAEAAKETVLAAGYSISRAGAERWIAGSPEKSAAIHAKVTPVVRSSGDFQLLIYHTWGRLMGDPSAEIPGEITRSPASPIFLALKYSLQHDCVKAEPYADTVLSKPFPPEAKLSALTALARCYTKSGRYNDALTAINQGLAVREARISFLYPDALVVSGKIYEEMGNSKEALAVYDRFLDLWKRADKDLPLLMDVQKRIAKLKSVSSR